MVILESIYIFIKDCFFQVRKIISFFAARIFNKYLLNTIQIIMRIQCTIKEFWTLDQTCTVGWTISKSITKSFSKPDRLNSWQYTHPNILHKFKENQTSKIGGVLDKTDGNLYTPNFSAEA